MLSFRSVKAKPDGRWITQVAVDTTHHTLRCSSSPPISPHMPTTRAKRSKNDSPSCMDKSITGTTKHFQEPSAAPAAAPPAVPGSTTFTFPSNGHHCLLPATAATPTISPTPRNVPASQSPTTPSCHPSPPSLVTDAANTILSRNVTTPPLSDVINAFA